MMNDFEKQLDAIRVKLYEQTKHMSNAEAAKTINENGKKTADRYGITVVKSAGHTPLPNLKVQ